MIVINTKDKNKKIISIEIKNPKGKLSNNK